MITIKNLKVSYGKNTVLNIDNEVVFEKGDFVGVIGSNGAGKTTLIKSCLGLTPYKGEIKFTVSRDNIAVHMQDNEYLETVSVSSIIKGLLGVSPGKNEKLDNLIEFFEFKPHLKKKYKNLSGGLQQRLTLILVLFSDMPITFLDEVTTGLDFETRQQLMGKINTWYEGKDATVLLVTHYYDEIEALANKILVLDKGRVVEYGEIDELFQKHVGNSAIIVSNLDESELEGFKTIKAPDNKIAISCQNSNDEKRAYEFLLGKQVNFERTNKDIELIYLNVLDRVNNGEEQ